MAEDKTAGLIAEALDATPAVEKERGKRKAAEAENKQLRALLASQQELLNESRKKRAALAPLASFVEPGEAFIRVIIPDVHGSILDETAAQAFLADLKALLML